MFKKFYGPVINAACLTKSFLVLGLCLVLFSCSLNSSTGPTHQVKYTVSDEDIMNPGRGFYYPYATKASSFEAVTEEELLRLRNTYSTPVGGNYQIRHGLFLRQYILDSFVNTKELSETFLQQLQHDFDTARKAGVKFIVRFSYNNVPPTGDCGSWICPPYGDASKDIVLAHIEQVSEVLSKNHDVLLTWQAGFIGTWGEMMFTDHFGDFDAQGRIYNENWDDRVEMVKAILDSVPKDITVQVRKPQLIQKFMHGPEAPVTAAPLHELQAFNGSDASRLGLYNDCFLATSDDWGTFADYGSSAKAPVNNDKVVNALKTHQAQHSRYTIVGGETCDDGYSPQNNCSHNVVDIIDRFNYTYLNSAYNNQVNNDWQDEGCMSDIKRRLGYRLAMVKGEFSSVANAGGLMIFSLDIDNLGFTSPMFPMQLRVIFTHNTSGQEYAVVLDSERYDIRSWRPESNVRIEENLQLPASMERGQYHLSLHIADVSNGGIISHRPEYSIQFANQGTWQPQKGYNSLLQSIQVNN
ncbi:DUF4832 domain-containing protein [Paraglaciecola sp.]|uniref:DUF4832 domain-containing protein n=1 Tax=Paraglaciecola sp. TaxID=1920173 RepID=UPI00326364AA